VWKYPELGIQVVQKIEHLEKGFQGSAWCCEFHGRDGIAESAVSDCCDKPFYKISHITLLTNQLFFNLFCSISGSHQLFHPHATYYDRGSDSIGIAMARIAAKNSKKTKKKSDQGVLWWRDE
jgi:hypothetical protein